eukprot:CAMPEP_0173321854 /NCGR_PEP_ID=MMETSP1143-20121109/29648_1 /TAXON_ID=483371 /ORGANISM="non described non described, Strain CCMP2298" /LENGTH=33 /DNA_ID= /DNA_START= /DNA_END= /DNA_ORIENTATION=
MTPPAYMSTTQRDMLGLLNPQLSAPPDHWHDWA